jgi:hypothetical protein
MDEKFSELVKRIDDNGTENYIQEFSTEEEDDED